MKKNIDFWINNATKELVDEIKSMNEKQLEESFSGSMEFGTAGMRGIIGPGPSKMNIYTVAKATYGYAKYLKEALSNKKDIKIVVATDNRNKREDFLEVVSGVLSSFGIIVYRNELVPTPILSYAIRNLKADGGINITASHNPKEYNGYKVYDNLGGQVLPDVAKKITDFTKDYDEYVTYKYEANPEIINDIPKFVFDTYKEKILKLNNDKLDKKIKIVFSPEHGTSAKYIPEYLSALGYEVINVVEQMEPDHHFKNTKSPNPENMEAYELGIKYLEKHNADLLMVIDPDADRVGVAVKDGEKYKIINGNEMGAIIFDNIVKKTPNLSDSYMVYSTVSSNLPAIIAKKNGVEVIEVTTGFKWIADIIEKMKDKKFIFGFEESYGSLVDSDIARDKDAIQSAVMIAEVANRAKNEGKTFLDNLNDIYREYSYFKEKTITKTFAGINSSQDRENFMTRIRSDAKNMFNDEYQIVDYISGIKHVAPTNLIKFIFSNGSWIACRPSGTEPKVKFYGIAIEKDEAKIESEAKKIFSYLSDLSKA